MKKKLATLVITFLVAAVNEFLPTAPRAQLHAFYDVMLAEKSSHSVPWWGPHPWRALRHGWHSPVRGPGMAGRILPFCIVTTSYVVKPNNCLAILLMWQIFYKLWCTVLCDRIGFFSLADLHARSELHLIIMCFSYTEVAAAGQHRTSGAQRQTLGGRLQDVYRNRTNWLASTGRSAQSTTNHPEKSWPGMYSCT